MSRRDSAGGQPNPNNGLRETSGPQRVPENTRPSVPVPQQGHRYGGASPYSAHRPGRPGHPAGPAGGFAFEGSVRYVNGRRVVLRLPPHLSRRNQEAAAHRAGLHTPPGAGNTRFQPPRYLSGRLPMPPAGRQARRGRPRQPTIYESAEEEWDRADSDTTTIGEDDDRGSGHDDEDADDDEGDEDGGQAARPARRSFIDRLRRLCPRPEAGRGRDGAVDAQGPATHRGRVSPALSGRAHAGPRGDNDVDKDGQPVQE